LGVFVRGVLANRKPNLKGFGFQFIINLLLAGLLFSLSNMTYAAVVSVLVHTSPNVPLPIDLNSSITGVTDPQVALGSQPSFGTAEVSGATTVIYTPNQDVADVTDTFTYQVDNGGTIESATITVVIGEAVTQGSSQQQAINDSLAQVCLQPQEGTLADLCAAFNTATSTGIPADLREFLDALTLKDIAAQNDLGNDMARQQVESIVKRLSALRHGMREAASGKLALNLDGKSIAWNAHGGETGGGASADRVGGNLGWYITGNGNFGNRQETTTEAGYKFKSGTITSGMDYRFTDKAVLGGALGYGRTAMKIDNYEDDKLDVSGFTSTVYASVFPSQSTNIDAVISYNRQKFKASNRFVFGQTDAVIDGSTKSNLWAASLGFGWDAIHMGGTTLALATKYNYLQSTIAGYDEGNSDFHFTFDKRKNKEQNLDLGTVLSVASNFSWGVIVHQFDLSWIHRLSSEAETIQGSFVVGTYSSPFEVQTNKPDTDYGKAAYGLQSIWPGGDTLYFQLQTTFAKQNYFDVGVAAGFRSEF
jgi:hypothetical protein